MNLLSLPYGRYIVWTSLYDLHQLDLNLQRRALCENDIRDLVEILASIFDDWVPDAKAAVGSILYPGEVASFVDLESSSELDDARLRAPLAECEAYLRSPEMTRFFELVGQCLDAMALHGLPPFDQRGQPIPLETLWKEE